MSPLTFFTGHLAYQSGEGVRAWFCYDVGGARVAGMAHMDRALVAEAQGSGRQHVGV